MPTPDHTARSPWTRRALRRGMQPGRAAAVGVAVTIVAAGVMVAVPINHATEAMFLVLPVALAAAAGGRRAGLVVAVAATFALSLVFPPIGSPEVTVLEDVVALAVFAFVAAVVGIVVAIRIDALRRVERHQAALLRAVSHDLRTPLASIRAALSELEEPDLHDDLARARLVRAARVESERLERLVTNLLSMARIEADALQPDRHPVDLRDLLTDSSERLFFPLRDATVLIDVPEDVPLVHLDPALFEQVMINLMENAARHSPIGGVIAVVVRHSADEITIDVCDEGPGVDLEELPHIFEVFRVGNQPGVGGVGLAICKAVVEAHDGTIAADNRAGGGARFRLVIPVG